jgi:hypothetical protein
MRFKIHRFVAMPFIKLSSCDIKALFMSLVGQYCRWFSEGFSALAMVSKLGYKASDPASLCSDFELSAAVKDFSAPIRTISAAVRLSKTSLIVVNNVWFSNVSCPTPGPA